MSYKTIDLFSGIGGLSYGFFRLPDFNIVMANEINPNIAKIYTANHPDVKMLNCDIKDITANDLDSDVDLIIGGPPCQSYSTLGKRRMDDRANLFLEYKRVLNIVKPKAFVFENVVGILSMEHGNLFKNIQKEFEDIGYDLKYKILDAVNYGVPQHRQRVILVGMLGKNIFEYPIPTHDKTSYVRVCDAIGDLASIKSGETNNTYIKEPDNDFLKFVRNNPTTLTDHKSSKNNSKLIKIMQTLKDGEGKNDLPVDIRPKSGYGNTYAKLWWERPATTITRNFTCPSSSRCIHPRDSRALSIREGARLQSFPDNYILSGSDQTKKLGIGNAVPPLLSIAIADSIKMALDKTHLC